MTVMMRERSMMTDNIPRKDVPGLISEALEAAGLTQSELAKRIAKVRACSQCDGDGTIVPFGRRTRIECPSCEGTGRSRQKSHDQQLRRIRRFGQLPTEEYAADMARAFSPELVLPDDHFFVPRESEANFREASLAGLLELRAEVGALQALVDQQQAMIDELRRRLDNGEEDA